MGEKGDRVAGHHESSRRSRFRSFAPMDGYLRVANLVPGCAVEPGKVAAFGKYFDQKVDGYGALNKSRNTDFPLHI